MSPHVALRIGLTGGIGSGKSTVAHMLVERGAFLIDTDAIARSLTLPKGGAINSIRATFGDSVIDAQGGLDRLRMREMAFTDVSVKQQLEAILHPLIGRECALQARAHAQHPLVFDVPLLVESERWRHQVDRVLVIDCAEQTQIQRVTQRHGWTQESVLAVMAQQTRRQNRWAAADAIISNDELTLLQLAGEVELLWRHWVGTGADQRDPVEQSG